MSNIQIFNNPEFGEIRTVEQNGEPWFVGKDVAQALGYADPRSAISKKVDGLDRGVAKMATPSGEQEMTIINESGLYSLCFSSKLEGALVKYPRQNAQRRDNTTKEVTSELTYTEWYKAKGGTEAEQMWWTNERKRKNEKK